ncbi:MAG: hypothetical protein GT598_15360 [Bacteroidales bacterium]|nr:hypothetical protein [Bacteroidales bacterium]
MKRVLLSIVVVILSLLSTGCDEEHIYNYYVKNQNIDKIKILFKAYATDTPDSLDIFVNQIKLIYQYQSIGFPQNNIGMHFNKFEVYHKDMKSSTDFYQNNLWKYTVIDSDTAEFVLEIDSSYFDWGKGIPEVP